MKGNLTWGGTIDANHMQFIANLLTICEFAELPRHRIKKYRAMRKDRNRELLGKLTGCPQMIGVGNDDPGDDSLLVELSKWSLPQRNRINNKNSIPSNNCARKQVLLRRPIVRLPDKIGRDFIEISSSGHHVQRG